MPSSVLEVIPPPFLMETERLRVTSKVCPFAALKRSLTCALTSFSFAILGSCTNAPPRVLGGWSPVVAYLRHSMIVYRAVRGTRSTMICNAYRLATAVVAYDDSDRTEKLDHLNAIIVKGTDATDCELL
jgi:hypothetical protein